MEGQRDEPFPFVQSNPFYQGVACWFDVPDGAAVLGTVDSAPAAGSRQATWTQTEISTKWSPTATVRSAYT